MSIPQIRADWAQHMVYGAWVAAAAAAGVLVLAAAAGRPGLGLLAPAASLLAALLAGVAKEMADEVTSRRTRRRGLADRKAAMSEGRMLLTYPIPMPHEVSAADVVATLAGAFPVAIPLFLALWR